MKTYAGYVRVSHVGKRKGQSFHSPEDQAAEIQAWAKGRECRMEMLPPELDGKGDNPDRPIFRRAIEGVKAGEYDGVVVAYISRAGRDLRLMLDLWDEVEAAGGSVYSARENIDGSTASGRLQRNLLASIAQHELEERREGFERSRAGATAAGIWQQRQTPRGYRKDKITRRLVPDRQASDIPEAYAAYLAGTSVSEISRRLEMTQSGVRQLLRNRVYLGELRVGRNVNPSAHPSLIDVQTFEAVQAKLAAGIRPPRNGNGPSLLAGLVRCASCGHVMTRGNTGRKAVYLCRKFHSGETCAAPAGITVELLDSYVEPIAVAELERLRFIGSNSDRAKRAEEALANGEAELEAYLTSIAASDVGAKAFAIGARQRSEAVEEARQALRVELARTPAAPVAGLGSDVWKYANAHQRNTLLRGLLEAVVVRAVGRGRRVPVEDRARVIAHGTGLGLPRPVGGEAAGLVPIPFPDADGEGVLGVELAEN